MNPAHAVNQEACRLDGAAKGWRQSVYPQGDQGFAGKNQKDSDQLQKCTKRLNAFAALVSPWDLVVSMDLRHEHQGR